MQLAHWLALLERAERELAGAFRAVGEAHGDEVDVFHLCRRLAAQCERHAQRLAPCAERYGAEAGAAPAQLHAEAFAGPRDGGGSALLRDLQDLFLMATRCDVAWTLVGQAAQGARDEALLGIVRDCEGETTGQLRWLRTRMKAAAPQALVVER